LLFSALAALTSQEESCRKKLVENKKILEELLCGIKSTNKNVKYSACQCFVSLSRSDKMVKSIILEAGEFHKELQSILINNDTDVEL
jgi:nitrate/TMAO reductase-like tetraheme cytochrome c subunit